jgi:hypothetical protein
VLARQGTSRSRAASGRLSEEPPKLGCMLSAAGCAFLQITASMPYTIRKWWSTVSEKGVTTGASGYLGQHVRVNTMC